MFGNKQSYLENAALNLSDEALKRKIDNSRKGFKILWFPSMVSFLIGLVIVGISIFDGSFNFQYSRLFALLAITNFILISKFRAKADALEIILLQRQLQNKKLSQDEETTE